MKAVVISRASPNTVVTDSSKVADGENDQDPSRPQLSFRSNDEEILREVVRL